VFPVVSIIIASPAGLSGAMALFIPILLVVAAATKLIGCGLGAKLCGYDARESVQIGVGMISRGELAIVISLKGLSSGLLEMNMFSGIILVVILTTLVTPILLKFAFNEKSDTAKVASG